MIIMRNQLQNRKLSGPKIIQGMNSEAEQCEDRNGDLSEQDEGIADGERQSEVSKEEKARTASTTRFAGSGMNAEQRCETDFLLAEGEPMYC